MTLPQTPAAVPPGAGQPPQSSAPQTPPAGQPEQAEYLTKRQVEELLAQVKAETQSFSQSLVAKSNNKIKERITNLEATLKLQRDSGVQITPAQEQALKEKIVNQTLLEDAQPVQPTTPSGQPAQVPAGPETEPPDPITAVAWRKMAKAGVTIEESDKEYTEIVKPVAEAEDPLEFLDAIDKAIAAKQKRLASESLGRIPGAGGGEHASPLPPDMKPIDLFKLAYSKDRT